MSVKVIVSLFIVSLFILLGCNKDTLSVNPEDHLLYLKISEENSSVFEFLFDEKTGAKVINSSSNDIHGEILGAVRVPGKIKNALSFNNLSSRVEINMPWLGNTDTEKIPFEKSEISIVTWLKLYEGQSSACQHIIGDGYFGLKSFRVQVESGKLQFLLHDNTDWRLVSTSNQTLRNDEWQHIAITYNGTLAKIYINGIEDKTNSISFPVPTVYNTIYVGSTPVDFNSGYIFGNQLLGEIDELRVFTKELTEQEVQFYYNINE